MHVHIAMFFFPIKWVPPCMRQHGLMHGLVRWDALEHKTDILSEISLVSVASSLTLPHANLNTMLALMQYHLVQRGILTQAQREIDFPHGFRGFGPRHPAAVVSVSGSLSSSLSNGKLARPIMTAALKWSIELSGKVLLMEARVKVNVFLHLFIVVLKPSFSFHTIYENIYREREKKVLYICGVYIYVLFKCPLFSYFLLITSSSRVVKCLVTMNEGTVAD